LLEQQWRLGGQVVFHRQYKHCDSQVMRVSDDLKLYELAQKLILAETSIHSAVSYQGSVKLASGAELSRASRKVIVYAKEIYRKNLLLLEKGFTPETNNVMEQLFSLIDNLVDQARSFKFTTYSL